MSAYKIETWTKRGYSEEEAKYQIKIRRPSNEEYYIHKYGVTFEEATKLKYEHNIKAGKAAASRPIEEIRASSNKCKEFWVKRGYSEEEAKQEISKLQKTFSKAICIEKYGQEEGLKIFQERQDKWQATLNNKSKDEKDKINRSKNSKDIKSFINKYGPEEGMIKFKECLLSSNCKVFNTIEELETIIKNEYKPFDRYLPIKKFIKKYIRTYFWHLVKKPKNIETWLKSFINFEVENNMVIQPWGFYNMHLDDALLRSGNEIYFYKLLEQHNYKYRIDFFIDKFYNEKSNLRYDFYFPKKNIYVELCGSDNEEYKQNMYYKEQTFGSKLLWNQKDYEQFIKEELNDN